MGLSRLQKSSLEFIAYKPFVMINSEQFDSFLNQKLLENGLKVVSVAQDGNCFFTAVALNMLQDLC